MENKSHIESPQLLAHDKALFNHFNLQLNNSAQILGLRKTQIKQLHRIAFFLYFYAGFHNHTNLYLCDSSSKSFRCLKHLDLRDVSSSDFPIQKVLCASKYLRTAQSLTHFTLKDGHLNWIVGLAHFFKGLKKLEHLSLHFIEFKNCRFINQFFSSLKGLIRLNHLKVTIQTGEYVTTDVIAGLGAGLSELKALKTLYVDLSGLRFDSEHGFFRDFKAVKSLSSLTLKMRRARGVFDKFLVNIGQSLKQMTALESFEIDLENCLRITNQGFEGLSSSLPQSLKSLKMNFGSCRQMEEKTVQGLFCSIRKMTFLEHLSIWFWCRKEIRSQELLDLNLCLSGLKWLKSLLISYHDCNLAIDELAYDEFLWVLASKAALRSLILQFPGRSCHLMDNSRLEKFADLLENLKALEIFELDVSCNHVDDKGIDYFSNKLEALEKLSSLHLNFSHCSLGKITVLERLIRNLGKLQSLSQAILNFDNSHSFNMDMIKSIIPRHDTIKFKLSVLYDNAQYIPIKFRR